MAGIFGSGPGLFGAGKSNVEQQIEIVNDQIQEMQDNPELSDVHKAREIKKLELVKAQIIEGAERAGREAETFERERDLFSD